MIDCTLLKSSESSGKHKQKFNNSKRSECILFLQNSSNLLYMGKGGSNWSLRFMIIIEGKAMFYTAGSVLGLERYVESLPVDIYMTAGFK